MAQYVSHMRGAGQADDDIATCLQDVESSLTAAEDAINLIVSGRTSDSKKASEALKQVKRQQRNLQIEASNATGSTATKQFNCMGQSGTVAELSAWIKSKHGQMHKRLDDATKSELTRGARGPFDASKATATDIVDEAMRVQAQDRSAVNRMQRVISSTEEVAAATMTEMQRQTDQLGRIHQDLEEIEDTLKLAKVQIRNFLRRQATDKIIVGFTALITLGILAILILHAVGTLGDDDVNVPDVVPDFKV